MPFLRAGFNGRHHDTGICAWTRPAAGGRFALAELIRFEAGDYAWHGKRFLAWGENVVLGSWPFEFPDEWQHGLPQSKLPDPGTKAARIVKLTIYGEPASKANSRSLVMVGSGAKRRPLFIKSEKARDYERDAIMQIPPKARLRMEGPMRVTIHIFYATERPDLDESIVLDVLQDRHEGSKEERVLVQKGVYRNDRQVREKHIYHAIDRINPRAEIEVEPIAGELFDQEAA